MIRLMLCLLLVGCQNFDDFIGSNLDREYVSALFGEPMHAEGDRTFYCVISKMHPSTVVQVWSARWSNHITVGPMSYREIYLHVGEDVDKACNDGIDRYARDLKTQERW